MTNKSDKPKRTSRIPLIVPPYDGLTGKHRFIDSNGNLVVAEWEWRNVRSAA